ncbi:asparagine synthase-related protein [Amycolatopsis silviterrae]|uniref:Asparagine synthase-related protein n=1 Tax=Amycolatopsis silviterrae TaxID=1656914 RepID=A0ABW5H7R0_9PSEU
MEFMVFPDSPAGARLASVVNAASVRTGTDRIRNLTYASGRPWIVGRWSSEEVTCAEAGSRRVALFGPAAASPRSLAAVLDSVRDLSDFDQLARSTAGSFHLVAAIGDGCRVQGSAGGSRRVFHGSRNGVSVAGDRADLIAALIGSRVAKRALARQLLSSVIPWPLNDETVWEGVHRLAADHYWVLRPHGSAKTLWWTPPDPAIPLAEGREAICAALLEAVEVRARHGEVTADLSGGMDSTSVCFLAAAVVPRLVTYRIEAGDPANDDRVWAENAARSLPAADHRVVARGSLPANFAGLLEPDPDLEAPFPWIRTRARIEDQARYLAKAGSSGHLTGHNGDQLFYAMPNVDHALLRERPLRAWRLLHVNRIARRWKLIPAARALLDNRSYGQWLADAADSLAQPQSGPARPDYDWGAELRMPPWATEECGASVAGDLRSCAGAMPLHPIRAQHTVLEFARHGADELRRASRIGERFGVPWHSPYADDQVLHAALSIRLSDRAAPDAYKPALASAMQETVPEALLARPTKAESSIDLYEGLQTHRGELLELCEDTRLGRYGLVDEVRLRAAVLMPHPQPWTMAPLVQTLAAETWLRSVDAFHSGRVAAFAADKLSPAGEAL